MPFLDHLEELRWRIIWSLLALVVGVVIGFVVVTKLPVLPWLSSPIEPYLCPDPQLPAACQKLKYLSPSDPFFISMKLALWVGVILAAPVMIYQIWAFISPALLPHEKRVIVPALYMGLVLFILGVVGCYFVVLPLTLGFLTGFQTQAMEASIVANNYLGFVTQMLLAFGVMFELPVVIMILSVLGVVDSKKLASGRRYALVIITIASAIVTPADVLSCLMLMVPLLLLYELSILLAKVVERRRERAAANDPWADAPWTA